MAVKKPAGLKKPMREEKPAASVKTTAAQGKKNMWTLPIAMLMLLVAASALWMAMRESSNRTQAATPAATSAVMSPDGGTRATAKPGDTVLPSAKPAATTTAASTVPVKPVSVTGCLQRADQGFVLKNTEGADAPKSRSWKSGFLKRSSSSVALSDGGTAHLADHVGQRVSVTGPLADREMHVTSLRRIAASCQ
jgi:hypothetical protein